MKTILTLIGVALGLCFGTVQASDSISTNRTQDLAHYYHHYYYHHHHHHHHHTVIVIH